MEFRRETGIVGATKGSSKYSSRTVLCRDVDAVDRFPSSVVSYELPACMKPGQRWPVKLDAPDDRCTETFSAADDEYSSVFPSCGRPLSTMCFSRLLAKSLKNCKGARDILHPFMQSEARDPLTLEDDDDEY
jgi:hypothetical protein